MRTESAVTLPMYFSADARRTKDGTVYLANIKVRGAPTTFEYLPEDLKAAALEALAVDARAMFDDLDPMIPVAKVGS